MGYFTMDVSNLIQNYNVNLEQTALNQFGAAVGNFENKAGVGQLSQVSNPIIDSIRTNAASQNATQSFSEPPVQLGSGTWESSKYASDLIAYAPKHRFIFKVKFIFNDPYSRINREFMYVVKEIDKPKVTFEYEDINMYNFKTKVLKSIRHEPLNIAFHDDIQNKVLDFFNAYRVAYSPVSSLSYNEKDLMEDAGMDFYEPDTGGVNSASMGILANGNKNILSYIEVIQVYAHGSRQNSFIFTNPRIENFDFDNLSHESSEGNGLTVSFNYDSLHIHDDITSGTPDPKWGVTDILGNSESSPRSQFGNMTMGGDIVRPQSSIPNISNGFLGGASNAISSAFPKLNTNNIISSANNQLSGIKATLASAIPNVTNATSKMINNLGFGDADTRNQDAFEANFPVTTSEDGVDPAYLV